MNLIALAEMAGAFLITQADFMRRLLGTAQLTAGQWGIALLAAVVLPSAGRPVSGSRAEDPSQACDCADPITREGLVPVLPSCGGYLPDTPPHAKGSHHRCAAGSPRRAH